MSRNSSAPTVQGPGRHREETCRPPLIPHEAPAHVARLLALLTDVRPTPRGWSSRCPAHADRRPSLGVGIGRDHRALLHCRAGCRPEEILQALDLGWDDLFAE